MWYIQFQSKWIFPMDIITAQQNVMENLAWPIKIYFKIKGIDWEKRKFTYLYFLRIQKDTKKHKSIIMFRERWLWLCSFSWMLPNGVLSNLMKLWHALDKLLWWVSTEYYIVLYYCAAFIIMTFFSCINIDLKHELYSALFYTKISNMD